MWPVFFDAGLSAPDNVLVLQMRDLRLRGVLAQDSDVLLSKNLWNE